MQNSEPPPLQVVPAIIVRVISHQNMNSPDLVKAHHIHGAREGDVIGRETEDLLPLKSLLCHHIDGGDGGGQHRGHHEGH